MNSVQTKDTKNPIQCLAIILTPFEIKQFLVSVCIPSMKTWCIYFYRLNVAGVILPTPLSFIH